MLCNSLSKIDGIVSLYMTFEILSVTNLASCFLLQANRLTELSGISMLTELTELHISDQGIESLTELTPQVFY